MSCWCEFRNDAFIFGSNRLTCKVITKDDEDNIYRPKENLSEFYEKLKNKLECKMSFDCKNKVMTISYPQYDCNYNSRQSVKFEIEDLIITTPYDSCFEAICEFLKQFQFVM